MNGNSPAIIALAIIIIFVIIVVVALSWHPAPALVNKEECVNAKELLKSKQTKKNSPSALASPRDVDIISDSGSAVTSDAWAVIRKLRESRGPV